MQVSKHLIIIFLLYFTVSVSCIDPFYPKLTETQDLLVVDGKITDQPGKYYIKISRSSPFEQPGFIPVQGCVINVEDGDRVSVTYSESKPGIYEAYLDENFLGINKAYKLYITTPDGTEYQSEYDSLLPCPPVDSLYFELKTLETVNPDVNYYGIRFLVDVKGNLNESRNFLWKFVETWEYHAWYMIQYFWDGKSLHDFPNPGLLYTCYKTQPIEELYIASTKYLVANELNRFPLTCVTNQTEKLKIKYSLLVLQHSLSNNAFVYFDKVINQLNETGSLYEKQPSSSVGNIFNVNDKNEKVLGYFYASQIKEKRIFARYTFPFPYNNCELDTILQLNELGTSQYYLISLNMETGEGPPYGYGYYCFDCTCRGGTTKIPDFWQEDD